MGDITTNVREIDFPLKGHNAVVGILDNFLYPRLVKLNSENGLVKYIKALHEAIVSEADFWLAQEMKSPKKPFLFLSIFKLKLTKYKSRSRSAVQYKKDK